MRTKTILLTAALVAAGVASSMAQSSNVYSLNVVGYVNVTLVPGFNLITVPLQSSDPSNSVNVCLTNITPTLGGGAYLYTWNAAAGTYNAGILAGGDGNWYDPTGSFQVTTPLPPGEAFFIQNINGVNLTATLVGTVVQGTNSYPVNTGYGFYGNFEPVTGDITTNGFPIVDNSALITWNAGQQKYNTSYYGIGTDQSAYDGSGNLLGTPAPYPVLSFDGSTRAVYTNTPGAGFIYQNPGAATNWSQKFTVAQ